MKNLIMSMFVICIIGISLVGCQTTAPQTPESPAITQGPSETDSRSIAEVTFINNAGFLITSGDYKILIDALHVDSPYGGSSPPEEVLQQMIEGVPPFDGIDLLLFTHEHFDHFSHNYVQELMENNTGVIMVSNKAAVEKMMAIDTNLEKRMIAIELGEGETEQIIAAGIEIEALYISHGTPDIVNLGLIIELPGVKFFHSGDISAEDVSLSDLMVYGLHRKRIDIAFLPLYLFEDVKYHAHIEQGVQAKYMIPMHYPHDEQSPIWVRDSFPDAILFSDSMEVWELPLETTSKSISDESFLGDSSGISLGEIVSFTTEEDITLSGTLIGDGEVAVILAHQGTWLTDQTSWHPFAQVLADEGFTALTFDFRGRGVSDGRFVSGYLINDMNAAIKFLRERGYEKIVCVGASMGGTSCMRAALDDGLVGLVVFASTLTLGEPTTVRPGELVNLSIPKLFLTAENDNPMVTNAMDRMYDYSLEPKEIYIFEGLSEHGTDLFDTDVGDELTDILLTFINSLME